MSSPCGPWPGMSGRQAGTSPAWCHSPSSRSSTTSRARTWRGRTTRPWRSSGLGSMRCPGLCRWLKSSDARGITSWRPTRPRSRPSTRPRSPIASARSSVSIRRRRELMDRPGPSRTHAYDAVTRRSAVPWRLGDAASPRPRPAWRRTRCLLEGSATRGFLAWSAGDPCPAAYNQEVEARRGSDLGAL
jgi:hypothetical protein